MDGLLIDSERIYTEVTNEILGQYGKEMTWDIKAGLMGMPEREAAAHLLSFFPDLPPTFTIDTYLTQRRTGPTLAVRWRRPASRHLHRHGVPLALATGSQRRNFALKSAHLHDTLFGCFEGRVVCPDDGLLAPGRGKPCPDVFLVAAERWLGRRVGVEPAGVEELSERARGLVFEDAVAGVQAGKRAGMNVVWVPDPNLLALAATRSRALNSRTRCSASTPQLVRLSPLQGPALM
ncbi:hypothetical protein A0H81_09203 [Grifola frondosa]|uniref:Pseudouridine-5'-phosphatase n=1 Tax=Grifola frondosa TaxID=5627 RepID=A0A1C7M1S3_GRIFR|nr:hypothetical protein A0H81_09203 [Grifola frondosa]